MGQGLVKGRAWENKNNIGITATLRNDNNLKNILSGKRQSLK